VAAARGARQRFSRFLFLHESAALPPHAPRAESPVMAARRVSVLLCGSSRVVRLDAAVARAGAAPEVAARRAAAVDGPADWGAEWAAAVGRAAAGLRDPERAAEAVDVVVPSVLVLTRGAACPRATASRRREALAAYAAGAAMPFPLAETAWMHAVTGGDAAAIDLSVFAARAETVEALLGGLESAGFRPRSVWPAPLALQIALPPAAAAAAEPQFAFHADGTSAVLWRLHRGRTWARSFRLPAVFAAAAVKERAGIVAREVRRTEVHFQRSGAEGTPERLWVAGDDVAAPAVVAALAQRLGLEVTPFPPAEEAGGGLAAVESGALQLAGRGAEESGMIPPARRAARESRAAGLWWLVAGTLAAAALLVVAVPLHLRTRDREAALDRLRQDTAVRREAALALEAGEARIVALEADAARLERFLAQRATWLSFLADLEERCLRLGDIRLEQLEVEGGESLDAAAEVVRVRLGGLARAATAQDAMQRVRSLAAALVGSAAVASVGVPEVTRAGAGARFDLRVVLRRAGDLGAEDGAAEDEETALEEARTDRSKTSSPTGVTRPRSIGLHFLFAGVRKARPYRWGRRRSLDRLARGARSGVLHVAGVETGVGDPGYRVGETGVGDPGYRFGDGAGGEGTDGGEAR
jgi:hypothetical protein